MPAIAPTRRIFAMLRQKCPLLYLSCFSHGPQGLSSIPTSCEVVLALASSGHVAATKVAAEEWPQLCLLVGSCWRCAFLVDDIYTRLYAFKNRTCVHQRFNMFCIYPSKYKAITRLACILPCLLLCRARCSHCGLFANATHGGLKMSRCLQMWLCSSHFIGTPVSNYSPCYCLVAATTISAAACHEPQLSAAILLSFSFHTPPLQQPLPIWPQPLLQQQP